VVGRPDQRWGEIPVACVVSQPGSDIQGTDIVALFEGRLARYKHPREVIFMDALPRNAMGKVEKFTLRDELANDDG
jgi:fatty-acyl-CoA synthase